jgi:hypothetical protein
MVDMRTESCATKTTLLTQWQSAAEAYSKAVAELAKQVGILPKDEYEKLKQAADTAHKRALEAQAGLKIHMREHGCEGDGEAAA